MNINTVGDLIDKISEERVWRIREISALKLACASSSNSLETKRVLRRSFIPMAYAHWEGFVKKVAEYYLEFVSRQRMKLDELQPCFLSVYLTTEYAKDLAKNKKSSLLDVCNRIILSGDERIHLVRKGVISTGSNLKSDVLKEICLCLGIPFVDFEIKKVFIDTLLVGKRNHIAHGEYQSIDFSEIEEISDNLFELIDIFRNHIENAAIGQNFKRVRSPE